MSQDIEIGEAQKTRRSARTDQVGKVFIVVGQRIRRCLVCEELFTRRAASEHAAVPCVPGTKVQPGRKSHADRRAIANLRRGAA